MNKRPLILITNDDGITARGIHCLAEAVKDLGDIIVVAPDGPRSGQSSAITVDSLLRLTPREFGEGIEAYSVNGTPADCVKLAMHALMRERRPDIILAGINHGSNSGNSVNYSGTMGAVIEGCFAGVPSVGYSLLDHSHNADFSFILPMVTEITRKVLSTGLPKDICLNINFPKGIVPKGLKMAAGALYYDRLRSPRCATANIPLPETRRTRSESQAMKRCQPHKHGSLRHATKGRAHDATRPVKYGR